MTSNNNINTSITSVGAYLPPHIFTNKELEKLVDTSDEWILVRTGIKERRIQIEEDLATSDMIVEAVNEILEKKNLRADEIDCMIVATVTPDYKLPATANIVCEKLGAVNAWGFDINSACSGFIHALSVGHGYIQTGKYKKVIVVGADKMSSIINPKDRNTVIIFGDGAGAALLEPTYENVGIKDFAFKSEGEGLEHLLIKAGGSLNKLSPESLLAGEHYLKQEGQPIFKAAVKSMSSISKELMEQNNLTIDDIDYFVPHQANIRIIDAVAKELHMPMSKVKVNIEKYGNTTAGTIPLCLWELEQQCKKGDLLLLTAFGAGFSWGSVLLKWGY
ncbi:MAG: beta-ketoacyl-ACP synthase III [Bacteroidales bacterium]